MRNGRQIHFRASARECDVLNAIAEQEGTTASAILRQLIRAYVRQRESGTPASLPDPVRTNDRTRDSAKPAFSRSR